MTVVTCKMAGCPDLQVARACSVACAKEAQVIKRLVYKNKSQHRRDRNFQKLQKLSKGLGRLQEVQLCDLLRRGPWSLSGEGDYGQQCRQQLAEVHACLQQMVELCEECFNGCRQQLELGFFVPINLVVSASVSRVKLLLELLRLCVENVLHSATAGDVSSQQTKLVVPGLKEDFGEPVMLSKEEIAQREVECGRGRKLYTHHVKSCRSRRLFVKLLVPTSGGLLTIKTRHPKGLSPFVALSTYTRSRFTTSRRWLERGTMWTVVLQRVK